MVHPESGGLQDNITFVRSCSFLDSFDRTLVNDLMLHNFLRSEDLAEDVANHAGAGELVVRHLYINQNQFVCFGFNSEEELSLLDVDELHRLQEQGQFLLYELEADLGQFVVVVDDIDVVALPVTAESDYLVLTGLAVYEGRQSVVAVVLDDSTEDITNRKSRFERQECRVWQYFG